MTRNTFFAAMMFGMMTMVTLTSNAQPRGAGRGHEMNAPREMRMNARGGMEMRGHDMHMDRRAMDMRPMDARFDMPPPPRHDRWDRDGYLYGWEGRVRHFDDGRWGYLRDGGWYYYDTYYEPDYYFAQPLDHFRGHLLSDKGRRVAGAVAGAVAVTALIAALCR